MKTRNQIMQDIRGWYKLGGEVLNIQEDKTAKCIMYDAGMWTEATQQAIAGENPYTIRVHSERIYPYMKYRLAISVYYEE